MFTSITILQASEILFIYSQSETVTQFIIICAFDFQFTIFFSISRTIACNFDIIRRIFTNDNLFKDGISTQITMLLPSCGSDW